MLKLIAATLGGLFAVLYVFGAEDRRVEVSRQAVGDDATGFTLASFSIPPIEIAPLASNDFGISDEEAVQLALKAGADLRGDYASKPLYGVVAAVDAAGVEAATAPIEDTSFDMWYVTGSTVNLRAGPGTDNAVVGRLGYGDAAEVIGDDGGWYQIRTADGATSGWIFGKFLANDLPG